MGIDFQFQILTNTNFLFCKKLWYMFWRNKCFFFFTSINVRFCEYFEQNTKCINSKDIFSPTQFGQHFCISCLSENHQWSPLERPLRCVLSSRVVSLVDECYFWHICRTAPATFLSQIKVFSIWMDADLKTIVNNSSLGKRRKAAVCVVQLLEKILLLFNGFNVQRRLFMGEKKTSCKFIYPVLHNWRYHQINRWANNGQSYI